MNFNKLYYFCIILIIFFSSCKIQGSFRGLYSYYEVSKKEKPEMFIVVEEDINLCTLRNQGDKVYIITGQQLLECLKDVESAIVYNWVSGCPSEHCLSLNYVQEINDSLGTELYIVAKYYDIEKLALNYNIQKPIFGINTEFYKSNRMKKYFSRYMNDLAIHHPNRSRYLYFQNGVLVNNSNELFEIISPH